LFPHSFQFVILPNPVGDYTTPNSGVGTGAGERGLKGAEFRGRPCGHLGLKGLERSW
jgi:hypothetical protein